MRITIDKDERSGAGPRVLAAPECESAPSAAAPCPAEATGVHE